MCGFVGFVGTAEMIGEVKKAKRLERPLARLRRRGPDECGLWFDRHAALAHARLALRDLSPSGRQPAHSPSGRFVVLYNGNLLDTSRLTNGDLQWRGSREQDTSALVHGLDRLGVETTIDQLDGMYALAVWDRIAGELTLARDPFGLKPLCYSPLAQGLWFGSTLQGLPDAIDAQDALSIDHEAIAFAVGLGFVPAPLTPYRNVRKLMPGERRRYRRDGTLISAEARSAADHILRTVASPERDPDVFDIPGLDQAVKVSVRQAAESAGRVGLFLSGGIDSSLVAMTLVELEIPFQAYVLGFASPDFDETEAAVTVAKALGLKLTVVRPDDGEVLNAAQHVFEAYDEPFGDPSMIPTLLLCERAAQDIHVALCGDGADELFGGYARQHALAARWSDETLNFLPESRSETAASLSRRFDRWESRRVQVGKSSVRSRARDYEDITAMTTPDLMPQGLVSWEVRLGLDTGLLAAVAPPRAAKALDMAGCFTNMMATKIDRAGMAYGLEIRPPLLSRDLLALASDHADDSHRSGGWTKYPLRQLLSKKLPSSIWSRPKRGFSPPLGEWLRGPLRDWADDEFRSQLLSSLPLDRTALLRMWEAHLSGSDHARALWPVLTTLHWLRSGHGSADR